MALIVITVCDNAQGDVDVGVQGEPAIDLSQPRAMLTGAQVAALNMLDTLKSTIKEDRGLIELLN